MTSTHRRVLTKLAGGAFAALLGIASTAALLPATAGANQATSSVRIAGSDRYGTAAALATAAFTGVKVNQVVLASGENFPDGLSASGLAGAAGAPILLTQKDVLPSVTANALGTLTNAPASTTVYVVGGTAAISQAVRDQVKALGYKLVELSGTDRYDTSNKVATQLNALATPGTFNGQAAAFVATGEQFPDALAAGVPAYAKAIPVVLTTAAALSSSAASTLSSLSIKQAIIMGGTAAVSQATEDAIKAKGITVTRMAGTNRYDTAAKLATFITTPAAASGLGTFTAPYGITLANGLNFPDALAAPQFAARGTTNTALVPATSTSKGAGPLLLTASIPAETSAFLTANKASIDNIAAAGGTAVISDADLAAAKTAATTTTPTATIASQQGYTTATVTFSEAIANGALTPANYTINNIAFTGSVATLTPAGSTAPTSVLLSGITQGTGAGGSLASGDTIAIKTASLSTSDGRFVPATSFSVAADVTKPSATISPYVGTGRTWVFFSEPVTTSTFTTGDLTVTAGPGNLTPGAFGAAPTITWYDATPGSVTQASTALVTNGGLGAVNFGSGDQVNLTAGGVFDPAGNSNTAATGTAINDTSGPSSILSAKVSSAATPGSLATVTVGGGAGTVSVTAKAGTATAGAAGNNWSVSIVDNNAATSVSVNSTTKIVTINADVDNSAGLGQPTAASVAAALNADTSFNALFTAASASTGTFTTTQAATALSGATNTTNLTITFNEPIDPTSVAATDFSLDLNGDGVADITAAGAIVTTSQFKSGTIILTLVQGSTSLIPVAGVAKVIVPGQGAALPHSGAGVGGTGVDDLANNVNTATLSAVFS